MRDRPRAVRFALKNLWKAVCGYELTPGETNEAHNDKQEPTKISITVTTR